MTGEWRLSAVEFDVLWREVTGAGPPYPLEIPSPGTTDEERAGIVAAVHAELARRDTDGLTEALTLVATSAVLIDGHLVLDDHIRLAAARAGDRAAVVLQLRDRLIVRALPGPGLGAALVELLPATPPASGQSVTLPHQALAGALTRLGEGGSVWDFEQALREARVRGPDLRWLAGLATASRSHGAQLGVTVRTEGGGEQRPGFLSWYATEDGGVVIHRPTAGDWVTVAPGDAARAVSRLLELTRATEEPPTV